MDNHSQCVDLVSQEKLNTLTYIDTGGYKARRRLCYAETPKYSGHTNSLKTTETSLVAGAATSHHELQSRQTAKIPTPQGSSRCRPNLWDKENKMRCGC